MCQHHNSLGSTVICPPSARDCVCTCTAPATHAYLSPRGGCGAAAQHARLRAPRSTRAGGAAPRPTHAGRWLLPLPQHGVSPRREGAGRWMLGPPAGACRHAVDEQLLPQPGCPGGRLTHSARASVVAAERQGRGPQRLAAVAGQPRECSAEQVCVAACTCPTAASAW